VGSPTIGKISESRCPGPSAKWPLRRSSTYTVGCGEPADQEAGAAAVPDGDRAGGDRPFFEDSAPRLIRRCVRHRHRGAPGWDAACLGATGEPRQPVVILWSRCAWVVVFGARWHAVHDHGLVPECRTRRQSRSLTQAFLTVRRVGAGSRSRGGDRRNDLGMSVSVLAIL